MHTHLMLSKRNYQLPSGEIDLVGYFLVIMASQDGDASMNNLNNS